MKNSPSLLRKQGVYFLDHWPSCQKLENLLGSKKIFIICDQKLKKKIHFGQNSKSIYYVKAGENLKNIFKFGGHVQKIARKISSLPSSPSLFVGLGGGSVTDFTGFFAHLYKRGKEAAYIPTTLLAALDASHGGKTAMNTLEVKNFLGSYHFPKRVLIIKDLLQNTSKKNLHSACGELFKIALIQRGSLYKKLIQNKRVNFESFWSLLPLGIQVKLDLVHQDPFETKNKRRFLNFGHTLGHVFEIHHRLSHGQAVALGLCFAVDWSVKKKFLHPKVGNEIINQLQRWTQYPKIPRLPSSQVEKTLKEDKKTRGLKIDFIFLKNIGRPWIQPVSVKEILRFYKTWQMKFRI